MLADDLFPRHFIYSLESPSNYCGAQKYFFESNTNVRFINDYDDKVFPLRHKKEWDGDKLFPSFYHSIMSVNTVRKYVQSLEKKRLITTEWTMVRTKSGKAHNGTLKYTIRPIQEAIDYYEEIQMKRLYAEAARRRAEEALAKYDEKHRNRAV